MSNRKRKRVHNDDESDRSDDVEVINPNGIIVSIVENRTREVCITKVSLHMSCSLQIFLVNDGHGYHETLLLLADIMPSEILLHEGMRNSTLCSKVDQEFRKQSRVLFISRKYFDQDSGAQLLKVVMKGQIDADVISKYTVLSASYCLLRYIENKYDLSFPPNSVRIDLASSLKGKLMMDRRTALNLELIQNLQSGNQKESLFGTINHTKTTVGARLLRSSLLQPLAETISINCRQQAVAALLRNDKGFSEIIDLLRKYPDLDKMLSGLSFVPKTLTLRTARTGIDTLIFILGAVRVSKRMAYTLSQFQSRSNGDNPMIEQNLLSILAKNLSNQELTSIEAEISTIVNESITFSKSTYEMRYQECFAIKSGVVGLLDVARKTYLQSVEEIYKLAEEYSRQHLTECKVMFSDARGYYLCLPVSAMDHLPECFIQAVLNKKTISCSTLEINSLSDRSQESITQALSITNDVIQSTLDSLRSNSDALFNLTDSVALLDMLCSFADLVALSPLPYTPPEVVNEDIPLVIQAGRHAVVSTTLYHNKTTNNFVANNTNVPYGRTLTIITGPNGSGKTVYLKQIALIIILAQIGCFVPAEFVQFSVRSRILSRLGTSDDMENNLSTFATEMKETKYLLDNIDDKSLVLIDELGRGSSNVDGFSLAFAVAEYLLTTKALVFFVTHYPQITYLAALNSKAQNLHMKTQISDENNEMIDSRRITFMHRAVEGVCQLHSKYGIAASELCGLPTQVVERAKQLHKILRDRYPMLLLEDLKCLDAQNEVYQALKIILADSSLSEQQKRIHLHALRTAISPSLAERLQQL